jgi:hypothetical protein
MMNMMRSWFMKRGAQQGLDVVASRWLGGRKARAQGREKGEGPSLVITAITTIFC